MKQKSKRMPGRPRAKRVNPRYLISRDGVEVGIYPGFTSVEAVKRAKAQHGRGTYTAEKIGADMYLGRGGEDIAAQERLERQREYRAERLRTKKHNPPYSIEHKAPTSTTGAPAYDLTQVYPDDVYQHPEWYDAEPEAMRIHRMLRTVRNKPKAKLTVYRAIPKGIKSGINLGDWITLSRQYAILHGQKVFGAKNYQILKAIIPAEYIWFDGNSILESGFDNSMKNPRKTQYILPSEVPRLYKRYSIETQFIHYLLTGDGRGLSPLELSQVNHMFNQLPFGFWVRTDTVKDAYGHIFGNLTTCRVMEYWTGNKKYYKPIRNGTHIHANNIDHLDVSKVHNPLDWTDKYVVIALGSFIDDSFGYDYYSLRLEDRAKLFRAVERSREGADNIAGVYDVYQGFKVDEFEDTFIKTPMRVVIDPSTETVSVLENLPNTSKSEQLNPARPVRRMAYTLGTWWQPYIEYGDDSDVTIEEIKQWEAFSKRLEPGGHWSFNEDTYFGKDDVTGKRGDVSDAVYVIVG